MCGAQISETERFPGLTPLWKQPEMFLTDESGDQRAVAVHLPVVVCMVVCLHSSDRRTKPAASCSLGLCGSRKLTNLFALKAFKKKFSEIQ